MEGVALSKFFSSSAFGFSSTGNVIFLPHVVCIVSRSVSDIPSQLYAMACTCVVMLATVLLLVYYIFFLFKEVIRLKRHHDREQALLK